MSYRIDPAEVRRAIELIAPPVYELRALNCRVAGTYRPGTYSGYFQRDRVDDLLEALSHITAASGVYITPNEVNPALLARSPNRARIVSDKEPLTGDKDIVCRRWLLIDVDPVRPAGISSTTAEKAAAEQVATAIDCWFWERGFAPGIFADSGNGCHLLLPVNMPAADARRVEKLLKYLDAQFSTPAAKVDVSVFNAARIWRLYGSESRKGADAPELGRPWRVSRVVCECKTTSDDRPRGSL